MMVWLPEFSAVRFSTVQVPVIADADIGYGNRNNGARTVREYGASGVAVIYLDDTVF